MILFHLDRQNTFPSDKAKQLSYPINITNTTAANNLFRTIYPHGISKTGERYLSYFDVRSETFEQSKETCFNYRIYTIEYIFETVRSFLFPERPSRFTSLFACSDPKGIKYWYELLKNNTMDTSKASVKIIEPSGITFTADSYWRDEPVSLSSSHMDWSTFSPFVYHERAKQYWRGKFTDHPSIEVLCELPVTVCENIPLQTFLNRFLDKS